MVCVCLFLFLSWSVGCVYVFLGGGALDGAPRNQLGLHYGPNEADPGTYFVSLKGMALCVCVWQYLPKRMSNFPNAHTT